MLASIAFILFWRHAMPRRRERPDGARNRDHRSRDLRELDRGRFGIVRMLLPERSANISLANSQLFALPSMVFVREAIGRELDSYIAGHKASR